MLASNAPEPQDLAAEAIRGLEAVVDDLKEIIRLVEKEEARRGMTVRGQSPQAWSL